MLNFVAIDFETANNSRNSACSLAAVTVENGEIVKKAYSLIKPPQLQFDPRCVDIHGIEPEMVLEKPTFAELWPAIYENHLKGKIVIAHNAKFDMEVLRATLQHYDLDLPNLKYSCTLKISRKVWPELPRHKLNVVGDFLGITFQHHQALDDAMTCAKIAIAAAKEYNVNSMDALLDHCGLTYSPFIEDVSQVQTSFF